MAIEVVLAEAGGALRASLAYAEGITAGMAIEAAAELPSFSHIDLATMPMGVYGEVVEPEYVLRDGDRVELYRPLRADPKESRRLRAEGKLPE